MVQKLSSGCQHNYSTKIRQAGCVSEQSLYSLMSMGIYLITLSNALPMQSLFIFVLIVVILGVILVFVVAPNFDLQIIIHQACRLVQCFKPLELVPFRTNAIRTNVLEPR